MARREFSVDALLPHGHHQNWDLMEAIVEELERLTDQWPSAETSIDVKGKRELFESYNSMLDARIDLGEDARDVTEVDISRTEQDSDDSDMYVSITLTKSKRDRSWIYAHGPVKRTCEELVRNLQGFILQEIAAPRSSRGNSAAANGTMSRLQYLHPAIKASAMSRLASGHGDEAVEEACKSVGARLRQLTGLGDDGVQLVGNSLGKNGVLVINDARTQSDASEQEGYVHLGMALYQAARNPRAHRPSDPNFDEDEVVEWLSVASVMHRALDRAKLVRRAP